MWTAKYCRVLDRAVHCTSVPVVDFSTVRCGEVGCCFKAVYCTLEPVQVSTVYSTNEVIIARIDSLWEESTQQV